MNQNNIELRVLIKGKPIVNYYHNGQNFVEGRSGSNFELEVHNRNPFRVEAVISVDGVSVIDGKAAGPQSSGYLIEANASVRIPGWKVNSGTAAKFEFTGKDGSYATGQTGSSQNNGVIGVMAFKDRNYRAPVYVSHTMGGSIRSAGLLSMGGSPSWSAGYNASPLMGHAVEREEKTRGGIISSSAKTKGIAPQTSYTASLSSADAVAMAAPETASLNNLGTGFGSATEFETTTVQFDRGDLQAMLVIYYDNARGLKARGIQVGRESRTRHTAVQPQAFPAQNCPVPTGWKG